MWKTQQDQQGGTQRKNKETRLMQQNGRFKVKIHSGVNVIRTPENSASTFGLLRINIPVFKK